MTLSTETKVALVTGASGGIGAETARRLARGGFTVIVNYAGSAASAEAVVREIDGRRQGDHRPGRRGRPCRRAPAV